MDAHAWFVVARLLHVVFGALWLGAAALIAVFLIPSVRAAGPAGGAVMQQLTAVRRMPQAILAVSWVALLSGAYMYWHASSGLQGSWMGTKAGITFAIGGTLALVAEAIGLFVSTPTAARMGAVAAAVQTHGGPPTPDEAGQIQALQLRMYRAAQAIALLLTVTVAAMAVGYYI